MYYIEEDCRQLVSAVEEFREALDNVAFDVEEITKEKFLEILEIIDDYLGSVEFLTYELQSSINSKE